MDNRPWFMYASIEELLAEPTDRPWFMTASLETLLGGRNDKEEWAQVEKLLGGRDSEAEWAQGTNTDHESMDTGTPSAAYLHARINVLTHQLRSRMMNIIDLTKPPEHHTITTIATDQLEMDVESTALIRVAEEIMVLTRELKDLWLFGGLDTLQGEKGQADAAIEADAKVVYNFLRKMDNSHIEPSAASHPRRQE